MVSKASVTPRGLVIALLLAALPALIAVGTGLEVFQRWDLLVSAAILSASLAMILLRGEKTSLISSPMALSMLVLIVPTVFVQLRNPVPATNDERSYLFQAELFAEGSLADPVQLNEWVDDSLRQRQVHDFRELKRRYSKYGPATSAALTPGIWLGWPPLMVLLAGVLDLILVSLIARRMGLARHHMAALLLATSPFFLLAQTSFQSEVFTLPAALAGYLALLKARQNPPDGPIFPAFLVGVCSGWIFLGRPLTGVVFATSMALGLFLGKDAPRLKGIFGAILGGLPMLFLALAYNRAQTGDWFLYPYKSYAGMFGPWENPGAVAADRIPIDVYGNGDWMQGLLRQLARWAVAFGGMLGAVGLAWWGLWRHRHKDGGASAAFALFLPVAYSLHWYPGHWGYLGPLYCLESLGFLVVGLLLLLSDAPKAWRNNLLLGMVAWGAILFVLRLQPLSEEVFRRSQPERAAVEMPDNSVLLLPFLANPAMQEDTMKYWSPTRKPASRRVAIVRELPNPELTAKALKALGLEERPVFRLTPVDSESEIQEYEAVKIDFLK
jgi:hypothetical protein